MYLDDEWEEIKEREYLYRIIHWVIDIQLPLPIELDRYLILKSTGKETLAHIE